MADVINEESDRERWLSIKAVWERDRRPGVVVLGNRTYRVFRLPEDKLEFREDKEPKNYYESTSF